MKNYNISQYAIMLYAFLLPLSKASIVSFSIIFFIALLLGNRAEFKELFMKLWNNNLLRYLSIFILMNTISLLFVDAENMKAGVSYVKRYYYLIIPAIFIYTTLKRKYIDKVLSAFLTGMFVSELISYSMALGFIDFIEKSNHVGPTPFMNHLDYTMFLALTSLILLNRLMNEKIIRFKIIYLLFFMSTTVNLFMIGGRSGQLAFIVSLFVLFVINIKSKSRAIIIYLIVLSSILLMAYNFSPLFKSRISQGIEDIDNIINTQNYCTSWGTRVGSLKIAKNIIINHPILGVGVQNNIVELRRVANENKELKCITWVNTYHNQYADVLTQLGFIGFALFMYIFYLIGTLKIKNKEFRNISVLLVTVFLVGFIADAFLYRHFIDGLFGLFLGLLLAQKSMEDNKKVLVKNEV